MSVPRQWHSGFNLWKWKHTLQASGGGEQNKPGLKAHGRPRELREASGTAVAPSFTAARRSPAAGLRAAFSLWEGASGWRRTPNPEGSPHCWARAGSDSRRPAAPTPKTTAEAAAAQAETPATAFPIPRGNSPAPHRPPREHRCSGSPPTAPPASPGPLRASTASPHSPPVPRREAVGQRRTTAWAEPRHIARPARIPAHAPAAAGGVGKLRAPSWLRAQPRGGPTPRAEWPWLATAGGPTAVERRSLSGRGAPQAERRELRAKFSPHRRLYQAAREAFLPLKGLVCLRVLAFHTLERGLHSLRAIYKRT